MIEKKLQMECYDLIIEYQFLRNISSQNFNYKIRYRILFSKSDKIPLLNHDQRMLKASHRVRCNKRVNDYSIVKYNMEAR